MISGDAVAAIMGRLKANFTAASIVEGENPDAVMPPETRAPFVMLEFPGAREDIASIGAPGSNLWREAGIFMVHVFVPRGGGLAAAHALGDAIYAIFRGASFEAVQCFGRRAAQAGPRYGGAWSGVSFAVEFARDRAA